MKPFAVIPSLALALLAAPITAQEAAEDSGAGEIIVTASRIESPAPQVILPPPVIGLKRQADSAVRTIEITSDSREEDMRKREVQAMLFAALDMAKRDGLSLVTGHYEIVEVTRANWQTQFSGLVIKADDEDEDDEEGDDDDDDEEENKPKPAYEDDGSTTTIRLKVKTKLAGSIDDAGKRISRFAKKVPATGRSEIIQKGQLALTIINPEQYRDEIYRLIAGGAKHAQSFYGPDYHLEVTGLDNAIAWKQVSRTDLFLYIQYDFAVTK